MAGPAFESRRRLRLASSGLAVAALCAVSFATAKLGAQKLPAYSAATAAMPAVWAERYPVAPEKFIANPGRRGVLRASFQGRYVYYYRFQAIVPRPVREEGSTAMQKSEPRTVEFWARYRSWLAKPWDLSFVREDRLPGTGKRWVQVGP